MRIYLSALGWIDDDPRGNRLRWHYPTASLRDAHHYVGLPATIVVERAPLDRTHMLENHEASSAYPITWWDAQPDVNVFSFVPPYEYVMPSPVQAITFAYEGAPARIVIQDSAGGRVIFDRLVSNGDIVYAEAAEIDTVRLFTSWATLKNVRTLDLFKDRGLPFRPIAKISVASTFAQPLLTIAPRYNTLPTTLSAAEWMDLQGLSADAVAASPDTAPTTEPTNWENFAIALAMRWEIALLAGFAFFDGPRSASCSLDSLSDEILKQLPSTTMAYRVVDADGPAGRSNVVLCAPWIAAPLSSPSSPWYVNPEVRLHEGKRASIAGSVLVSNKSLETFSPLSAFGAAYGVRLGMGWQQADGRASGVEIEEHVSASATTGSPGTQSTFVTRSRRPTDPALQGSLRRSFDVSFPDVTLQSRARAIDGWDRVSAWSAWTAPTPLVLRHEPPAPPLESAVYDAGTVRISRAVGKPDVADWEPDALVSRTGGQVAIYRRTGARRVVDVTATIPLQTTPGTYRVNITGAVNLADFIGGTLSAGGFTETIVAAGPSSVDFVVPDNGGAIPLFSTGAARLAQLPTNAALWTHVATFPANSLPPELVFSDPQPPAPALVVESYLARVSFLGRLGPQSNVVCGLRYPTVPVVPPPFVVDVLGVDFYRRTLIKLRFTSPPGSGRFTIWWADGIVSAADLASRGAPGRYAAQTTVGGVVLFDAIPLPIAVNVDRTITIGVQRVSDGGTQSDFVTSAVVLPALVV
jgi:hypothetical protein